MRKGVLSRLAKEEPRLVVKRSSLSQPRHQAGTGSNLLISKSVESMSFLHNKQPKNITSSPPMRRFDVVTDSAETSGPLTEEFLNGDKISCFLGLSSDTSSLNRERLTTILEWLAPRASKVLIIESTYLRRWNLMALNGLSERAALECINKDLNRFKRRLSSVKAELNLGDAVELCHLPTLCGIDEVSKIQQVLRTYAATNDSFRSDVELELREFLSRRGVQADIRQIELLLNYLYEEISLFIYLCLNDYHLEVYPGADLRIMKRIFGGYYTSFPFSCSQRSHLSIRLEPANHTIKTGHSIRNGVEDDMSAIWQIIDAWPTHFVEAARPLIHRDFHEGKTLIYEEYGSPLGFIIWSGSETEIELLWLAVHPDVLRKGIGCSLVAAVEALITSQTRVFLKTATTDSVIPGTTFCGPAYQGTNDFFSKLGYKPIERILNGWQLGNHCLIMEKQFPSKSWTSSLTTNSLKDLEGISARS